MKIIKKVALAPFKDKKILLVRTNKQENIFYTLGGRLKEGETDLECLKREVWEELGCSLDESSLKFLHEFEDVAHGRKNTLLNIRLYQGRLIGQPKPSSEIVEIRYFSSSSDKIHLSEIAQRKIFPWLKSYGYIN